MRTHDKNEPMRTHDKKEPVIAHDKKEPIKFMTKRKETLRELKTKIYPIIIMQNVDEHMTKKIYPMRTHDLQSSGVLV